ncbi:hypothetical protein F0562_008533 [Nyssa sinensis]|uniref:Uncharacterized protein n=1 Tax=Nyssa sinensis TaxID=561372 RepID=A0A5J5A7S2_9ASTE|nr:hypothetical protein F0562_008533 [Nyssa sinensis]
MECWVYESLPRAVMEVVDANLLEREDEIFTIKEKCWSSITEFALKCTTESSEERINMKDVLAKLKKIKTKFNENVRVEYGSAELVSTKGDVYSFGILLMETFTRKKPTDDLFLGELSMKCWVCKSLPSAVLRVVDANLLKRGDEIFTTKEKCLSSIMELALKYTAESPDERIDLKDVLTRLEKIKPNSIRI